MVGYLAVIAHKHLISVTYLRTARRVRRVLTLRRRVLRRPLTHTDFPTKRFNGLFICSNIRVILCLPYSIGVIGRMSVLYFALAIYIVGVALMLYIRPSTMFHPDNGTWKEFGLDNGPRSTVFPFWMFTIVWAFMSYAIATIGNVFIANVVLRSAPGESDVAIPISELAYEEPAPRVRAPRAPRMPKLLPPAPMPTPAVAAPSPMELSNIAPVAPEPVKLPGYYFVEPQASGIPRFVYFGHEPPSFENLVAHS